MDSETITARQIGYTYMINSSTFAKRYKDANAKYRRKHKCGQNDRQHCKKISRTFCFHGSSAEAAKHLLIIIF